MSTIGFKLIPTTPDLAAVVECFRIAEYRGSKSLSVNICPNGLPGIVFQVGSVSSIRTSSGSISDIPNLFVYGQVTEPSVMNFRPGPYKTFQTLLQPDALATLFDRDAPTLTNNFLTADDIGAEQLAQSLQTAKDYQVISLIGNFLRSKLKTAAVQRDPVVVQSLHLIDKQLSVVSVANLIRELDISERQFEKRFLRTVGTTPQLYIRIRRFNKAMQLMDSGAFDSLSDIAYALEFHDQSHFIRDIKSFSGKTPKGLSQKVDEFYHDQVGTSFL